MPTRIRLKSVVPPPTSQTSAISSSSSATALASRCSGDPRVERGDRFLEQRQVRQLRRLRRFDGQLARLLVERRRHGEHDPLALEPQAVVAGRDRRVPRVADVHQIARRRIDGRDPRTRRRAAPRQNRRAPIDARMGEPRFRGRDLPRRRQRAALARQHADDGAGIGSHGSATHAAGDFVRFREIEERRQHGPRLDDARRGELRNAEQLRPADRAGRVSTAATAELVVPRSMPIRNGVVGMSRGSALADVQLQLPPCSPSLSLHQSSSVPISVTRLSSVTGMTPSSADAAGSGGVERHLERAELLEVVAPVLDDASRADRSCGSWS